MVHAYWNYNNIIIKYFVIRYCRNELFEVPIREIYIQGQLLFCHSFRIAIRSRSNSVTIKVGCQDITGSVNLCQIFWKRWQHFFLENVNVLIWDRYNVHICRNVERSVRGKPWWNHYCRLFKYLNHATWLVLNAALHTNSSIESQIKKVYLTRNAISETFYKWLPSQTFPPAWRFF